MIKDDFTGNFCNQGKYPILKTINHYLNPAAKIPLPQYEITKELKGPEDKYVFKPKLESEFMIPTSAFIDTMSSDLLTSNQAVSLINNNGI